MCIYSVHAGNTANCIYIYIALNAHALTHTCASHMHAMSCTEIVSYWCGHPAGCTSQRDQPASSSCHWHVKKKQSDSALLEKTKMIPKTVPRKTTWCTCQVFPPHMLFAGLSTSPCKACQSLELWFWCRQPSWRGELYIDIYRIHIDQGVSDKSQASLPFHCPRSFPNAPDIKRGIVTNSQLWGSKWKTTITCDKLCGSPVVPLPCWSSWPHRRWRQAKGLGQEE